MEDIGMDLGKRESQIAIITEAGELIEKRMRTERERLRQFFADRPKARILVEATAKAGKAGRLHSSSSRCCSIKWESGDLRGRLGL